MNPTKTKKTKTKKEEAKMSSNVESKYSDKSFSERLTLLSSRLETYQKNGYMKEVELAELVPPETPSPAEEAMVLQILEMMDEIDRVLPEYSRTPSSG